MKFPFTLKSDAKFDAAGFGTNAIDHLVSVPAYPAFNSKVELTTYSVLAGGEIASSMAALQRLGLRTAYAGRFGDDAGGTVGIDSLKAEGVDVELVETIEGANTQVAFVIIDQQTGERTIIWKRDERLVYQADDAPLGLAVAAKVLHMTPHDTTAAASMAIEARRHGTVVSLDIDNLFDGIEDLLAATDIMICSSDLLERLTGMRDKLSAMTEAAARFGCRIVAVTLGNNGSNLLCDGVFVETPAFSVPGGCVDTTGAGDAFRAGFLYGVLRGESVEDSATMANAVAALKCRGVGARTFLPTRDELQTLLKNV
ncbi:MAG TPA: carbohydrate kinase family protein [Pyrinomonadaceae bacterium]|jgi:sugar/nucleoside kinase (ribokinase family)|nr:carbohydrate kinase family protein [Pyrinomonadaceae bacterium]